MPAWSTSSPRLLPERSRAVARKATVRKVSNALWVIGALCLVVPVTGYWQVDSSLPSQFAIGDLPEGLPHANEGSFVGGSTGTADDPGEALNLANLNGGGGGFDLPTGGRPSPLFEAQSFTQKMLRFEEFGRAPMPVSFAPPPLEMPGLASPQSCPDGAELDAFLGQSIYPEPTRLSNDTDVNPWLPQIESFLGQSLSHSPLEGRPPGEGWAHQRWSEFPPEIYVNTAQTGAHANGGLRDPLQHHSYSHGEFAQGNLYWNNTETPELGGSNAGLDVRFHPNMPIQDPLALWCFDGTLPPKLLMARYGEPILFRHYNATPIDPAANMGFGLHTITTHEHNGHNPAESDGYANAFSFPGQYYDYRWPMALAGHDSINPAGLDPRAGTPDGNGGITMIPGDWRETMSTHWFHDHMLDFTAQNVYKGNAAMMNYYSSIDRGNEGLIDGVNLRLPSGTAMDWGNRDYDVNLLIADKAWDAEGQLWFNIFNVNGFMGDQLLTNWLYHPYFEVRARRYRFRILNGSVSRYLKIGLVTESGTPVPFHMVANDGNIMEHSVRFDGSNGTTNSVLPTQGIAERYDIVIDFGQFQPGEKLYFVNTLEHNDGRRPEQAIPLAEILSGAYQAVNDGDRWVDGDPCVGKFLEFRVMEYIEEDLSMNPADFERGGLQMIPLARPSAAEIANATHRTFSFGRSSGTDDAPWTIKTDGGTGFNMDPRRLSAAPTLGDDGLGSLEIWHLENGGGGWSHPIHVHFEEGQILKRGGEDPPEWEVWARKDVYRVGRMPDSTDSVEFSIRFREFAGTFMEHCHNTQHEDHAMLLRWDIENPGQFLLMPTPFPTWEGVEYVDSVALPTFRSGDGTGTSFQAGGLGESAFAPFPEGDGTTPPAEDPAAEESTADSVEISKCRYDVEDTEWRVEGECGDSTSVEVFFGSTLMAMVEVDNGEFEFRGPGPNPGGGGTVTVVTSLGGTASSSVEIHD